MTTETVDWTEKYQELHEMLDERYQWVDRALEERAWETIHPLSAQIWSIIREHLTNDNCEELSKQAYCVAIQAVLYHVENREVP